MPIVAAQKMTSKKGSIIQRKRAVTPISKARKAQSSVFRLAVSMVSQGLGGGRGGVAGKTAVRRETQTIFLYCWQQVNP